MTESSGATILKEFWIADSGVSQVNGVSEATGFEVSEFMRCKVTEMQSFSDLTIKVYFRWLFYCD